MALSLIVSVFPMMREPKKKQIQCDIGLTSKMVRGVGFEPTNPCGTAASGLRL